MPLIIEEKAAHDVTGFQWSYKLDQSAGVKNSMGVCTKKPLKLYALK